MAVYHRVRADFAAGADLHIRADNGVGADFDAAVELEVSDEVVVGRLTTRRGCKNCGEIYNTVTKPTRAAGICDKCGGPVVQRDDDREEVIRKRLAVYHEQTAPLIEYYRAQGILVTVDATGGKDVVLKTLEQRAAR